jgi:hypothetical protein
MKRSTRNQIVPRWVLRIRGLDDAKAIAQKTLGSPAQKGPMVCHRRFCDLVLLRATASVQQACIA